MTEAEDNRPEWMIELENRKRKPRLAHEAGAGSPCLSCKEACPGLDLHFWRKICKNCKCGRDEHDVVDDEFPQFDLLLGHSGRPRRKAIFLPVAIKKQAEKENVFEWIPPDISTEIAADYMKALPESKLPIQGSAGAALRKQQLQKQLPLHDMDHKACDKLSEAEKHQFEKYLENLKNYVGQGRVSKVMGAKPFNRALMTPANAADMQPMSPQRKPQGYLPSGEPSNLRTPSSFMPKVSGIPPVQGSQKQQSWLAANLEVIQAQIAENASSTDVPLGQYHPALDSISATGHIVNSELLNSNRHPAQQFANTAHLTDTEQNITSFLQNPENAQFIPDFGKVNYHTEYSQGQQFEPNSPAKTVTPSIDPNMNRSSSSKSSQSPILHNTNLENIEGTRSISHGFLSQPGQYHGAAVPLSRASETTIQNKNTELLHRDYSSPNKYYRDSEQQLRKEDVGGTGRGVSTNNELRDTNRVPHNISSSDDMASANAQLAEQMLSDALLPPSAVHANEIIGSTLDRNKLKYIQEKLSAKYSKDDLPSQHTVKSQCLETSEPQFGQKIGNRHKGLYSQEPLLDNEVNRIAIIAAMRNPSGFLVDNQNLDRIGAEYTNPLEPPGHNKHSGLGAPRNNGSNQQLSLQESDLMLNNSENSSLPYPQDSTFPIQAKGNESHKVNQFPHQYLDTPSSTIIPNEQQQSRNAQHRLSDLEKLAQAWCNELDNNLGEGKGLSPYPITQDPGPRNEWNSRNPTSTSNFMHSSPSEQLRAELNHQPINSHIIHSQAVGNPSFPEGIIDSPGLRQNPASVDQLRGALEELAVEPVQLHKCTQCKEEIHSGDVVVTAERAKDAVWHPGCFICSTCEELLVDLVYFYHKGKLYCGRDLATLLNIPRCFACDELIFVREYTVAEGHNYHVKHFCCWDCDIPLAGQQYISENDRPLCLPCYQKTYAKTCKTCDKVIRADQQGVAVKNLDFHADDKCFACFTCKKSLLSGKMAIKEDRPFCSKECITEFLNNKP